MGLHFSAKWSAARVGPMYYSSGRPRTKRAFYNLNMCIVPSDLTAAATILQTAMRLFAERGAAEVTIRDIASAAGVSPSLVIHHYGSKDGLKEAVDVRATALVEAFVGELVDPSRGGAPATSFAGVFADRLEQEPVLASYVRRLLVDGGPGAESLFRSLFDATLGGLESLELVHLVRPAIENRVRAAFLLVNDLAVVLLRDQLRAVTGIDPLTRSGMARWTAQVLDIYVNGVFVLTDSPAAFEAPRWRILMSAIISSEGLTKYFGAHRGVDSLDFEVTRGETFGFLGPNGSGKSTTIRLLLGLYHPTAGHAKVFGQDPNRHAAANLRKIGYLPGELVLYPRLTGREHVDFVARLEGHRAIRRSRMQLVERFGVILDRPAHTLSKGNRQKIGLVLAFMHRPELLILDEPTSGLDPLMKASSSGL